LDELTPGTLVGLIALLIIFSAFFSGSETALMSLNRYRLRHLAQVGHRGARLAESLLKRPDRLIGLILLGNNFVNILASVLAATLAIRMGGNSSLWVVTLTLTIVILIFAETAPKTLAALRPEPVAFFAAHIYFPLLKLLYPLVVVVNLLANGILRLFGVTTTQSRLDALTREELRTVVMEAGALIPRRHQKMLLGILELEEVEVDDVMVPKSAVEGVDIAEGWDEVMAQIRRSRHTRIPLFEETIDDVVGILHTRNLFREMQSRELDETVLRELMVEPYFIPEGTPLNRQLLAFQSARQRMGLVVDEYGDIQGLVTLEDIMEEIVGELSQSQELRGRDVVGERDGGFLVRGTANLRNLNRHMEWDLPVDGPRTINGLVLERLETIPQVGDQIKVANFAVEVIQRTSHGVKLVLIKRREVEASEPRI
jgi:magnesium and cobalt exporter, CNNM family